MKRNRPRLNARQIRAIAEINAALSAAFFRQFDNVNKGTAARLGSVAQYPVNKTGIARIRAALRG